MIQLAGVRMRFLLMGAVYIEASLRYMGDIDSWAENVCQNLRRRPIWWSSRAANFSLLPFGKRDIVALCVPPPLVGVAP